MKKNNFYLVFILTLFIIGCASTGSFSKTKNNEANSVTNKIPKTCNVLDIGRGNNITYDEAKNCICNFVKEVTIEGGRVKTGTLIVHPAKSGGATTLDIDCVDSTGNSKLRSISIDELKKFSVISGLNYGVSADNKLLLIKEEGTNIQILKDKEGNYDLNDFKNFNKENYRSIEDLLKEGYVMVRGKKMQDGRIALSKDKGNNPSKRN